MQSDTVLGEAQRPHPTSIDGSAGRLRVAVVTESFLPSGDPVATGVCRTLEHLARRGHDTVVICPGPAPERFAGARVISVPSISYRQLSVGLPSTRVIRTLAAFAPDVVHLASPFVLGSAGVTAAGQLGLPSVAVFQPDVAGRLATARRASVRQAATWRWVRRVHEQADLTLAPSAQALSDLRAHSVPRTALWQPEVDSTRFTPHRRRSATVAALRARLAPDGEVLIGHAGPLPTGDRLQRLAELATLPGARLVLIGDGAGLPAPAALLGPLDGDELADACAALDVFVDTGAAGGCWREAMAGGVPVVAPAGSGPASLLAPGLNGLLHPETRDGLRTAVSALIGDADQRRWMGAAARAGVERRTWEQLGDELIGHYRGVLARRSVAA